MMFSRVENLLPTSDDCVRTAIATCGRGRYEDVRLARIRNTADTQFLQISAALLNEARNNPTLEVAEQGHPLDLCQSVRG